MFAQMTHIHFDKKKLGKVKELSLNNGQLSFHSITYKYESENSAVAYVQILANTNHLVFWFRLMLERWSLILP